MTDKTLPQSEVDRIEREADSYATHNWETVNEGPNFKTIKEAYIAGATTEASTSMSKAIAFVEWIRRNNIVHDSFIGCWYVNIETGERRMCTEAELYMHYSSQTETKL